MLRVVRGVLFMMMWGDPKRSNFSGRLLFGASISDATFTRFAKVQTAVTP